MGQGQSALDASAAASSSSSSSSLPPAPVVAASLLRAASLDRGNTEEGISLDQVESVDLTSRLSDDCLATIFSKLGTPDRNSCSLVCRRWYVVESQARQLLLLLARADIISFLPGLLTRFEHLTRLALKCDRKYLSIDDQGLCLIGKSAAQLERLKLKGCRQVTDTGLEGFSTSSHKLKKLSCGSCGFGARGLDALLGNCRMLEDLSVKKLKNAVEEPEEGIGHGGHGRLTRLCIKDLSNAHLFEPLVAGSRHLRTLVLARITGNWDSLLEGIVAAGGLQSLLELRVEKVHFTDRGLQAVAMCKSLQTLYVVKCPEVTNVGIAAVSTGCRSLRKLHLDGCFARRMGDEGLKSVGEKCPELQELVLIRLDVGASSLSVLAARCSSLERLAICNSETFADGELACVVFRCRSLRKLCIKGCPISDQGLVTLANGCPNLVKVKIRKCRFITTLGAVQLQKRRSNLVVVVDSLAGSRLEDNHNSDNETSTVLVAAAAVQAGGHTTAAAAAASSSSSSSSRVAVSRTSFVKARLGWLAGLRR